MNIQNDTSGYYKITIACFNHLPLLQSNSERAFIISTLQDLLSPRMIIGDIPAYRQLASCIDLLAFSILTHHIELLVFSIDKTITGTFTQSLLDHLDVFQDTNNTQKVIDLSKRYVKSTLLDSAEDALSETITLHSLHNDWEFDRYSSIGFYLHDRRGDWMRLWRLTRLYDNSHDTYRTAMARRDASLLYNAGAKPTLTSPLLAS